MDNQGKKTKKNVRKKAENEVRSKTEINYLNNNIRSIKIPERFDEKEKLLISLKSAIGDIDLKIKNLKSKKEYYLEIISILDKDLTEKRERQLQLNKEQSNISVIQEELYSKFLLNFYSFIVMQII
jgi:hypothetical protein